MSSRRTDASGTDMQTNSKSERNPTGHARFTAIFHPCGWWTLLRGFCTLSWNTLNKQSKQINTSADQVKFRTNTVHWKQSASDRVHLSNLFACPRTPPGKMKSFYILPQARFIIYRQMWCIIPFLQLGWSPLALVQVPHLICSQRLTNMHVLHRVSSVHCLVRYQSSPLSTSYPTTPKLFLNESYFEQSQCTC